MKKYNIKIFYAISFAWQLGFLIAIPLAGFIFLGFYLDKFFHTHPFFLIGGIIIGIITSIYETYHLIVPLIEKYDSH
ncbi:AtpZ/AtpI family protein [bacterium]|nr:AtpZ/AtpI family protein [bacterium]